MYQDSRGEYHLYRWKPDGGFTLVELLVSMSIFALLVVMVAQLTKSATDTTTLSSKQAGSDNTASTVFNIMRGDFDRMLRRSDVDYVFFKNNTGGGGNDSMWFYTDAVSYFVGGPPANSKSPIAFVGYRIPTINNRPDRVGDKDADDKNTKHPSYALERVAYPLNWLGGSYQRYFLTRGASTSTNPTPTPNPNSTFRRTNYYGIMAHPTLNDATYCNGDWRNSSAPTSVVSSEVFRLEFCFQMKDGTYMIPPSSIGGTDPAAEQMRRVGMDVSAIIVAIGILDAKSRVIVSDMAPAALALPDIVATDLTATPAKLMAEKWNNVLKSGTFAATARLPQVAASQVRVYQRTFYLGAR